MFKLEFECVENLCSQDTCDETISEAIENGQLGSDTNYKTPITLLQDAYQRAMGVIPKANRTLDIRVQPGSLADAKQLRDYARRSGINIRIEEFGNQ